MSVRAKAPARTGAAFRFAGYAALFGRRDLGGDNILPGAFAVSLSRRLTSGDKLPLLWQHRPGTRIGWVEDATEDDRGLRVIARLDDVTHPVALALKQGAVTGISFGYRATSFRKLPEGRDISEIELLEISLVTRPMQPLARVHLIS